jgi:hypothetical protein
MKALLIDPGAISPDSDGKFPTLTTLGATVCLPELL